MPEYVAPDIPVSAEELITDMQEQMADGFPGWQADDGDVFGWFMEVVANVGAENGLTATEVLNTIFMHIGRDLHEIPPNEATPAEGTTTWTVVDDAGYGFPAGTPLGKVGNEDVTFRLVDDLEIPPGETTAVGVFVTSEEEGTVGNGFTGALEILEPYDYWVSTELENPTAQGTEAETVEEYLQRLVEELSLMTRVAIEPADVPLVVKRVDGVERSVVLDGLDPDVNDLTWDPNDQDTWEDGAFGITAIDEAGEEVGPGVQADILDLFGPDRRLLNLKPSIVPPTYTEVDVTYEIHTWPEYDFAEVQVRADQAVADYLDPANFGRYDTFRVDDWVLETEVHREHLLQAIQAVEGVHHAKVLTINGVAGDLALPGHAPLPRAGDIVSTEIA